MATVRPCGSNAFPSCSHSVHTSEKPKPLCASVPAAMKKPAATLGKPAASGTMATATATLAQPEEARSDHCCCGTSWSSARTQRSHVAVGCSCARWPTEPLASCAIFHGGIPKWVGPSSMSWLELQLQKATAATKSKPAAMKGKGPTTKGHGKSTMAMSKPKAKTKK